jgi:hypothetical protein
MAILDQNIQKLFVIFKIVVLIELMADFLLIHLLLVLLFVLAGKDLAYIALAKELGVADKLLAVD